MIVLWLTVYPGCWTLINEFAACSRLLSDRWLICPSGGDWRRNGSLLGPRAFCHFVGPDEAIWARRELISQRRAPSLSPCGHLITRQHLNMNQSNFCHHVRWMPTSFLLFLCKDWTMFRDSRGEKAPWPILDYLQQCRSSKVYQCILETNTDNEAFNWHASVGFEDYIFWCGVRKKQAYQTCSRIH